MENKLSAYMALMRMDKPIGSLLLLWPTLCALWIASNGTPNPSYVWIFVLGVFVMRSAGCVINDYADRDIDGGVHRTAQRPLASGILTAKQALILFTGLLMLALVLLVQLPKAVWPWSLPAVLLTIIYPFMKRYIYAPQMVLGLAFSMSIPMAFICVLPSEAVLWSDPVLIALFVVNFLWVLMYDTVYAMSDRDEDLKIGVKSTAIWFGNWDKLIVAILQVAILGLWVFIMMTLSLDNNFIVSLLGMSGFFIYQQWLIKARESKACFQAFLNNAWVGATIWLGLVISLA